MIINVTKTFFVTHPNPRVDLNIMPDLIAIDKIKETKLLGIMFLSVSILTRMFTMY